MSNFHPHCSLPVELMAMVMKCRIWLQSMNGVELSQSFDIDGAGCYTMPTPGESNADCYEFCILGDLNGDSGWNVLDIVTLANCVLANSCVELGNACSGDMNQDGGYNVLDIVILTNCILANSCDQ